jgi:nitronate monooxygenase
VTSAGSAQAAIALGADYLVCQGTEAGGHVQASVPLLSALTEVLSVAGSTPVAASGGIGDGRDARRVMDAGAAGAMLGTRFVATQESAVHPAYKTALQRARAADTVLTTCFDGGWQSALHRVVRNGTFTRWESAGCPPGGKRPGEGDIVATQATGQPYARYAMSYPSATVSGAVEEMALYAGEGVERIGDLPPAGELVARLWAECLAEE